MKKRKLNVLTSYFTPNVNDRDNINVIKSSALPHTHNSTDDIAINKDKQITDTDTENIKHINVQVDNSSSSAVNITHNTTCDIAIDINTQIESDNIKVDELSSSAVSTTHTNTNTNCDIAFIAGKPIDDEKRLQIFNSVGAPVASFKFPVSGERNLKFQSTWLSRWNWLAYSQSTDGAFCSVCVIFGNKEQEYRAHIKLVKEPFRTWKNAVVAFDKHQSSEAHKLAALRQVGRAQVAAEKVESIGAQLDKALKEKVCENRAALKPIIETVIFCGRQGIALRGHGEKQPILDDSMENDGNFRALLRMRVQSGDIRLQRHLESAAKNAIYTSPQIQNEIINAGCRVITSRLVESINASNAFSVLADETTDIANVEQFSLCIRYFYAKSGRVREDFLRFVPVTDVTGEALAHTILSTLDDLGIDKRRLVGQGYDGAAAMSGRFNGAQSHIRAKHEHAVYVHCAAHSLNLAISDACSVSAIRHCMGALGQICVFFHTPKRQAVLTRMIGEMLPEVMSSKLKKLCPTRWVQRHESVMVYLELQVAAIASLEEIAAWDDKATSSTAHQLLATIATSEFQCAVRSIASIFAVTLPLSKFLQTESADLAMAMSFADTVIAELKNMRRCADTVFAKLFIEVEQFCRENEIDVKIPRRSKQRCDADVDTPEAYFRVSTFLPFLDSTMTQIEQRLLQHKQLLLGFTCLQRFSTAQFSAEDEENATMLFARYAHLLSCSPAVGLAEIKLWRRHMANVVRPVTMQDALSKSENTIFQTVRILLEIFVALPITTSSVERSFSSLRILKTYLRNTIGQERLNGLALMYVHRDIEVTAEEILNILALEQRRLEIRLK